MHQHLCRHYLCKSVTKLFTQSHFALNYSRHRATSLLIHGVQWLSFFGPPCTFHSSHTITHTHTHTHSNAFLCRETIFRNIHKTNQHPCDSKNDTLHQKIRTLANVDQFSKFFHWQNSQENSTWKRPCLVQTQARRHLRHSLVWASSMTVCCSPCYTSIIHCFSSLTSQILF